MQYTAQRNLQECFSRIEDPYNDHLIRPGDNKPRSISRYRDQLKVEFKSIITTPNKEATISHPYIASYPQKVKQVTSLQRCGTLYQTERSTEGL